MRTFLERWDERRDWFDLDSPPEIHRDNEEQARFYYARELRERFPQATDFAIQALVEIECCIGEAISYLSYGRYLVTGRLPRWLEDEMADVGPHEGCSEFA